MLDLRYDPFSIEARDDPYPTYDRLRAEAPVYHNPERGLWALSRFEDCQHAARTWKVFSSAHGVDLDSTGHLFGEGNFIEMDPPRHDLLRDVVRRIFAPKMIEQKAELIRQRCQELVDAFCDQGEADLARDFAWPLPVGIIAEMLGFTAGDRHRMSELFRTAMTRNVGDPALPEVAVKAGEEIRSYLADQIDWRRREPQDDLMTQVALASVEGDPLEREAIGMCFLLFSAGIDTTMSLISNSLFVLARYPEQRRLLAEDPTLIPQAVEEFLRFESPIQNIARRTTEPVEIHGTTIPADSWVLLLFGSANRDERRWEDAASLDVTREPKRHLGFGEGIHHCLGAPLARLEAKIAFDVLLRELPDYQVAAPPVRVNKQIVRGLETLRVTFEPAAALARPRAR